MPITFHPNGDITGTGASNFGQTGTVLQTVQATQTSEVSTSGTSFIDTGLSVKLRVHAASHGAGQILPVNSGKLLVECNVSKAFFHSCL